MEATGIAAPEMVGREVELSRLMRAFDVAAESEGGLVLLAGEAGIGKTRLTDELLKDASGKGARILRGWCLPDCLEPLMPMRTALGDAGLAHLVATEAPPRLLSLFLISDSGLLIARKEREESGIDPDIFAGMLSAVSSFVRDSLAGMGGGKGGRGLNTMGHDDYRILIENGRSCCLVAIVNGRENGAFLDGMRKLHGRIQETFAPALANWSGSAKDVDGVGPMLQEMFDSGRYEGRALTDDPKVVQEGLFDNALTGLRRLSEESPVVLFLDDLHWADHTTLNLLHYLARNLKGSRTLIIGTYRPEDIGNDADGKPHPLERAMQSMSRESLFERVELRRLAEANTRRLVESALGANELTDEFFRKVHAETGGTPFFVLEVVRLLAQEGMIARGRSGAWVQTGNLGGAAIPSKVYDVVKRRLDRLEGEHRDMLEIAAVIGDPFSSSVIAKVLELNKVRVMKALSEIAARHHLIHTRKEGHAFDHAKIREVLYGGISDELRREYHRLVGEAILETNPDGAGPVTGELAFHFMRAEDPRAGRYLALAGDRAQSTYSNEEAVESYTAALRFVSGREAVAVNASLGEVYGRIGDFDQALACFQLALEGETDPEAKASIHSRRAYIYDQLGENERSLEECTAGLGLVRGRGHPMTAVKLLNGLSWTYLRLGEHSKADECLAECMRLAEESHGKEEMARAMQGRGTIMRDRGDLDSAEECLLDSQRMSEEANDLQTLSSTLNNLGLISQHRGELAKGLDYFERSLQMYKRIGKKGELAIALTNIGNTYIDFGRFDKALECHGEALEINKAVGAKSSVAHSLTCIGYTYWELGEYQKAVDLAEESNRLCDETGYLTLKAYNHYSIGESRIMMGDPALALAAAAETMAVSREMGFPQGEALAHRLSGMALRDRGVWADAEREFEEALRIFTDVGERREEMRTKYEYALLLKARGDAARFTQLMREARNEYERMGMQVWVERAGKHL